jgi:hypothetical protein
MVFLSEFHGIPRNSAEFCTPNSVEFRRRKSEKIPISTEFQKSTSVDTLLQTENVTTENGSFLLFAANGKRKQQNAACLLQTETENGSLFFLVSKR